MVRFGRNQSNPLPLGERASLIDSLYKVVAEVTKSFRLQGSHLEILAVGAAALSRRGPVVQKLRQAVGSEAKVASGWLAGQR